MNDNIKKVLRKEIVRNLKYTIKFSLKSEIIIGRFKFHLISQINDRIDLMFDFKLRNSLDQKDFKNFTENAPYFIGGEVLNFGDYYKFELNFYDVTEQMDEIIDEIYKLITHS